MVYKIEPLDLKTLFGPVTAATAALARLDERLARSPVRGGWIERQHFADAAAALWLEGELVHVEDLVLHDAHMDIRMPTHELTRAHAVLRARRQIASRKPDWAVSAEGLRALTRRGRAEVDLVDTPAGQAPTADVEGGPLSAFADTGNDRQRQVANVGKPGSTEADNLTKALDAMDVVLERSAKIIEGQKAEPRPDRPSIQERLELVYDPGWDEDARLAEWRDVVISTRSLPVVLRAAILIDAWAEIEVLQHASWLGPLLVSSLLRQEGLAAHHLPYWSVGAKQIPRERRRARSRSDRLVALLDVVHEAARIGLKEHDRLIQAKGLMERRLKDKRKNSKLPELIELTLFRPLITAPLVAKELKVSLQGALNLLGELGLREVTGRGRFRAWGIL